MTRCPISYLECENTLYSPIGLKKLHPKLTELTPFPYNRDEQIHEATLRAGKISIQGVQPKLSVRLNLKSSCFELVDRNGLYILKPQSPTYPQLPENEDLTMRLAKVVGLNVPFHGLIHCKDKSLTYFIKRFDRPNLKQKHHTEDFAQAAQLDRENKYRYSMEKVVDLLNYCSYPMVERSKLFLLTLFSYLVGNEDLHLKNFSLIAIKNKIQLSPVYDLLNSTIVLQQIGRPLEEIEELALPIRGKRRKLTKEILVDYFGGERLELPTDVLKKHLTTLTQSYPIWLDLIESSFLDDTAKKLYKLLLDQRFDKLNG